MSKIRQQRTADNIQLILSDLFLRHLNDPRLQTITITKVLIDRELQHANIYVNALGDETRQADVMQALDRANGFLRRELSGRLRMRSTPQLHFHWDTALAHAEQIDQILENLHIPTEEEE